MKYEEWIKYERERLQAAKKRRPLLIVDPKTPRERKLSPQTPLAPNREASARLRRRRPLLDLFRSLWGG